MTIVMLTSLNLLSELGVEGEEDNNVLIAGGIGFFCIAVIVFINMIILNRTHTHHAQRQPSDLEVFHNNVRSQRTFTGSEIEDGAIAFALI